MLFTHSNNAGLNVALPALRKILSIGVTGRWALSTSCCRRTSSLRRGSSRRRTCKIDRNDKGLRQRRRRQRRRRLPLNLKSKTFFRVRSFDKFKIEKAVGGKWIKILQIFLQI